MWYSFLLLASLPSLNAKFLPIDPESIQPLSQSLNNAPVIGILSLPIKPYENFTVNGTSYMASSYVKYLEMAGARVVPIRIDHSFDELGYLFSRLNGILFTGGTANFWSNNNTNPPTLSPDYAAKGCYLYNLVKQSNDQGNFYPLWATCLGFELIHVCENNVLGTVSNFNGEPGYTAVSNFTAAANSSRIFTSQSAQWGQQIMGIMSTQNVTYLNHHHGISPSSYIQYPKLSNMYNILSTMRDKSGTQFVGMVEAKNYPIFGSQFHPEKNLYEWNEDVIPHFYDAVATTTYLSNFFVAQTRKNTNVFPQSQLTPSLIYNYPPIFINGYFETISAFN
jgi:gamma-glutamyl hydrolase